MHDQSTAPLRLGVIGTESTHFNALQDFLARNPQVGYIVATANDESQRLGGLHATADHYGEAGLDAVFIFERDGRKHAEQAVSVMSEGLPVFVDKPVAVSVPDAERIVLTAQTMGVAVTSCSALRWLVPEEVASTARQSVTTIQGPADRNSSYAGLFFYGSHLADLAVLLAGPNLELVDLIDTPVCISARLRAAGPDILLKFCADPTTDFVISVGAQRHTFSLAPGYYDPALRKALEMFSTGREPLPRAEMIATVNLIGLITDALV